MIDIKTNDKKTIITIDSNTYSEDVIYKCMYWYGAEFIVDIRKNEISNKFEITLQKKSNYEEKQNLNERIKQDLIDFKLRDIVTKETQVIRELITAKAFSNFQSDEIPSGDISDPIGYNPLL